jgi:hypothetical protein
MQYMAGAIRILDSAVYRAEGHSDLHYLGRVEEVGSYVRKH